MTNVEHTQEKMIEKVTPDPVVLEILEQGKRFHGHIGPFLATGIRMARLAIALLGTVEHIHSETGLEPPMSCILDGMQISTGCTLCNKKISFDTKKSPVATFTGPTGQKLRIELKQSILKQIELVSKETMQTLAMTVATQPANELFEWQNVRNE